LIERCSNVQVNRTEEDDQKQYVVSLATRSAAAAARVDDVFLLHLLELVHLAHVIAQLHLGYANDSHQRRTKEKRS